MRLRFLFALLPLLAFAGPAHAVTVLASFSGTLDTYTTTCPTFPPTPPGACQTIPISSPISGSFSYSTDPGYAITNSSITSDAFALFGQPTTLTSAGRTGSGYVTVSQFTVNFFNLLDSQVFGQLAQMQFNYPPGVLSGTTLGAELPPLSLTTSARFFFLNSESPGGQGPRLSGRITEFATTIVPEPTTWALMTLGLLTSGTSLRRRHRIAAASLARA